jgi:DNA modification methylase
MANGSGLNHSRQFSGSGTMGFAAVMLLSISHAAISFPENYSAIIESLKNKQSKRWRRSE